MGWAFGKEGLDGLKHGIGVLGVHGMVKGGGHGIEYDVTADFMITEYGKRYSVCNVDFFPSTCGSRSLLIDILSPLMLLLPSSTVYHCQKFVTRSAVIFYPELLRPQLHSHIVEPTIDSD